MTSNQQAIKTLINMAICYNKKEENSGACYNMNLENIVLREISQSQKDIYCITPLIGGTWNSQIS